MNGVQLLLPDSSSLSSSQDTLLSLPPTDDQALFPAGLPWFQTFLSELPWSVEQLNLSHNLLKALGVEMVQLRPDQGSDFQGNQLEVLASEALHWLSLVQLPHPGIQPPGPSPSGSRQSVPVLVSPSGSGPLDQLPQE